MEGIDEGAVAGAEGDRKPGDRCAAKLFRTNWQWYHMSSGIALRARPKAWLTSGWKPQAWIVAAGRAGVLAGFGVAGIGAGSGDSEAGGKRMSGRREGGGSGESIWRWGLHPSKVLSDSSSS